MTWCITVEYPPENIFHFIWAGASFEDGRERYIELLRDWLELGEEKGYTISPLGPSKYDMFDKNELQDIMLAITWAPQGWDIEHWVLGWNVRMEWTLLKGEVDVEPSTHVG